MNTMVSPTVPALEIKRSKRLKGQPSLLGDARQGFQALAMAALAEGPTKLENLPDTPWFKEILQAFIRLGYAQQALDGHWLVHGGHRPVEGGEPLRVRHAADLLALAAFLSGQGVRRTLEIDLDGVSTDVMDLLGRLIKLESPGDFSAVPEAAAAAEPTTESALEPDVVPEDAVADPVEDDLAGFIENPPEDSGETSDSITALRAITPESRRKRKAAPEPTPGPTGELNSGAAPDEEGRFLRLIPGEIQKKARDFTLGNLPGRPGQGPARLVDLGWDEYMSKLTLLSWHVAAGKPLDLSLQKGGPDLLETVAAQFGAPLRIDRNNEDEGDELARRIARRMRAAGKQETLTRLRLAGGARLKAQTYTIPADVTETAALCLAATLIKGSDLTLEGVILSPSRAGFLGALRRMGADIEVVSRRERQGETLGTLRVRSADLLGKRFGADHLSQMRDEIFLLMVAAAYAEGETILRDIAHLRRHRRDLLKAFAGALKTAGVEIGEIEDGLVIRGRSDYDGAAYDGLGHPPLALACLVMGLKSHGASTLAGAECLEGAYPGLRDRFAALAAPDKAGRKGAEAGGGVEDEMEEDEE